ncbi:MAG: hypothetical protein J0M04_16890 [Verrucomicrobia bacterium]|nr:hypothetical protein [Verrucomicrobiota bacterium]
MNPKLLAAGGLCLAAALFSGARIIHKEASTASQSSGLGARDRFGTCGDGAADPLNAIDGGHRKSSDRRVARFLPSKGSQDIEGRNPESFVAPRTRRPLTTSNTRRNANAGGFADMPSEQPEIPGVSEFGRAIPSEPRGRTPVAVQLAASALRGFTPNEIRLIHGMDESFSQALDQEQQLLGNDPEQAALYRRQAVELHDEYLRRTLGWDRFNQLSAIAAALHTRGQGGARGGVSGTVEQ